MEDLCHCVAKARGSYGNMNSDSSEIKLAVSMRSGPHCQGFGSRFGFELRSPLFSQPLSDLRQTLWEAGLNPNAILVCSDIPENRS